MTNGPKRPISTRSAIEPGALCDVRALSGHARAIRLRPCEPLIVDATATETMFEVTECIHGVPEASLGDVGFAALAARTVVACQKIGRAKRRSFTWLRMKGQEPSEVALKVLRPCP